MIRVEYNKKDSQLSLTGHAGMAEKGNDLVCAAVTTLWYTLTQKLQKDNIRFQMQEEEGYCVLNLKEQENELADVVIDTILCGLEQLAWNYPQYVFVKIS